MRCRCTRVLRCGDELGCSSARSGVSVPSRWSTSGSTSRWSKNTSRCWGPSGSASRSSRWSTPRSRRSRGHADSQGGDAGETRRPDACLRVGELELDARVLCLELRDPRGEVCDLALEVCDRRVEEAAEIGRCWRQRRRRWDWRQWRRRRRRQERRWRGQGRRRRRRWRGWRRRRRRGRWWRRRRRGGWWRSGHRRVGLVQQRLEGTEVATAVVCRRGWVVVRCLRVRAPKLCARGERARAIVDRRCRRVVGRPGEGTALRRSRVGAAPVVFLGDRGEVGESLVHAAVDLPLGLGPTPAHHGVG